MFSEASFYPVEPGIRTPLRLGVKAGQRTGNLFEKQTLILPYTCYFLLFEGRRRYHHDTAKISFGI